VVECQLHKTGRHSITTLETYPTLSTTLFFGICRDDDSSQVVLDRPTKYCKSVVAHLLNIHHLSCIQERRSLKWLMERRGLSGAQLVMVSTIIFLADQAAQDFPSRDAAALVSLRVAARNASHKNVLTIETKLLIDRCFSSRPLSNGPAIAPPPRPCPLLRPAEGRVLPCLLSAVRREVKQL
jgi:hypothetical protein